ncbi:MAG: hypothetical protein HKN30_10075 [Sulfitobacter sp.]|nr:hypothetical protein [Sulfitobacter sp.]
MLTHIRKGAATVVGLALLAGPALAVDHEVLIVDGAYFPPLIYADIGDHLMFVNSSSDAHEVQAVDASWTSGTIPVDGSFSLEITDETVLTFNATADTEGNSAEQGDVLLEQVGEVVIAPMVEVLTTSE